MKKDITIIIPARDEEASLKKLLKKFKFYKKLYKEIIVIDGKSKDNTIQVAKSNNCKVINQKGLGYGDAIIKGVNSVKTKYFIIFDADGSKDPVYLKRFIQKLKAKKSDIIFICVGTPTKKGGSAADLSQVFSVTKEISLRSSSASNKLQDEAHVVVGFPYLLKLINCKYLLLNAL